MVENGLPSEQEESINTKLKFSYKQKVRIVEGFYKGYIGTVTDYHYKQYSEGKFETIEIFYVIDLDKEKRSITINEKSLRKELKFVIPFVHN